MSSAPVDAAPAEGPSHVRVLSRPWRVLFLAWTTLAILLSFNQQFTLRFFIDRTLLDSEYYWLLVALLLPLAFVLYPLKPGLHADRVPWYDVLLFGTTTAIAGALIWSARDSAAGGWEYSGSDLAPRWLLAGAVAMWVLVLEALRRAGGLALTVIMGVFSVYPLFAGWVPAPLTSSSVSLLDAASFHVFSRESVLGIPLRAFAELVIGFLVFGTALQFTGAGTFFINLAFSICGRYRGGAAKVAIFSSGLLGTMSGSVISNVLTTGTMTIPAMKRTGFKASTAGAIEACASTGAVLAPPVMGATAFVMAEFLNIPYSDVALGAAVPAILYFFALFMQIDCIAGRQGMTGLAREELPRLRHVLRDGWYFVFVVVLLVVLLLVLKRETWAPWLATGLLLALNQAFSKQRWRWKDVSAFIDANGRVFVELMAILAGVGLLVGAFSLVGLTGTLTTALLHFAGNSTWLLIVTGALTSFVLGTGMTVTICYVFLAVLLAPSLVQAGLDPLAVHMFILYWGMVSYITPPVALAAFAAASVARAGPNETGLEAMKIGSIIYFVPFFFILNPAMVLRGDLTLLPLHLVTALAGVALVCGGLQGYLAGVGDLRPAHALEWPIRVALIAGGLMFVAPGGGLMPLSPLEMTLGAIVVAAPALALALALSRRAGARRPPAGTAGAGPASGH